MKRALSFTTLCLAIVALSACPSTAPSAPKSAGPLDASIELYPLDGDVWDFGVDVGGPIDQQCARVELAIDNAFATFVVDASVTNDEFLGRAPLRAGENVLVARCHDRIGRAVDSEPRVYTVKLEERPRAVPRVVVDAAAGELVLDASASAPSEGSRAPLVEVRWTDVDIALTEVSESVRIPLPSTNGSHAFALEVADANGEIDVAHALVVVENGVARVPDVSESPAWIDGAVVYGAVPVLFGYDGIASITERLDALVELGVDVIWVSPITEATFGDFGFDVVDHFAINPELGGEQDLRELVSAAHSRGLRVILDVVPNHTSNQHRYYVDAQENGEASRYWAFHDRDDESGDAEYYFDWEYLPNLDYDNAEVRRMITESFVHWVRDFDIDGFRIDVAWGVLDRDPTFWPELRAELRRIKPDVLLLGEASARDERVVNDVTRVNPASRGAFDVGYDWTDDLGIWAWQSAFYSEEPALRVSDLRVALDEVGRRRVLHFLDNNDTGARFRDEYGDDVTRVARALTMFAPGIASVYSGDEIGASFEPYEQYDPLPWDEGDPALFAEIAELIAIRKAHAAFASYDFAQVYVIVDDGDNEAILAFTRGSGDEELVVLISFDDVDTTLSLADLRADSFVDVVSGDVVDASAVTLGAFDYRVLRAQSP